MFAFRKALPPFLAHNCWPLSPATVVAHVVASHGVSERRACRILRVDRTSHRYRSRRPDDAALRERLRALAHARRRFGYCRLFILLRREGEMSGRNRIYRVYREEDGGLFAA